MNRSLLLLAACAAAIPWAASAQAPVMPAPGSGPFAREPVVVPARPMAPATPQIRELLPARPQPGALPLPPRRKPQLACGIVFASPCASAQNPVTARLQWGARADATHYRVLRDGQPLGWIGAGTTEYTDDSAPTGRVAGYQIEALRAKQVLRDLTGGPQWELGPDGRLQAREGANANGVQVLTDVVTLEASQWAPVALPSVQPVADLRAAVADAELGRVRLTWTPAPHATGYRLLRDGREAASLGPVSVHEESGLRPGPHRYQLVTLFDPGAGRALLVSPPSSEALLRMPAPQPFLVGTGVSDITGPIAELGFLGYASIDQKGTGLHTRLYARAFAFAEPASGRRVVFVSADLGMMFSSVKQAVVRRLQATHGALYDERNVMLSATHTHAGPGGFSHHALYNVTVGGFDAQNFQAIVDGIVEAIDAAHGSLARASVVHATGQLDGASVNRSEVAWLGNPEARTSPLINRDMDLLRIARGDEPVAAVAWFSVHNTVMNRLNTLVSSDHKGLAALLLEKRQRAAARRPGAERFVAAFPNGDEGDMSPGWALAHEKDFDRLYLRMRDLATLQAESAAKLMDGPGTHLDGEVDFRHRFVMMPGHAVRSGLANADGTRSLCPAAYGLSFAAGAEDGPSGVPLVAEGLRQDSPGVLAIDSAASLASVLRPYPWALAPGQAAIAALNLCHWPKPVLLPTGPLNAVASTLPFQLLRIGAVVIAGVPGEMTVQAGRRLRADLMQQLAPLGVQRVILAGLANEYSGYIVTPEEYQSQQYEGASTAFGVLTLDAYRQIFSELAADLASGRVSDPGTAPPDLSQAGHLQWQTGVVLDSANAAQPFGHVMKQPDAVYRPGSVVRVQFRSSHPKNDLKRNGSYFHVEREVSGSWTIVADDADPDTTLVWKRDAVTSSHVEITWRVPMPGEAIPGRYRIRHAGVAKTPTPVAYEGITRTFQIR